MALGISPQEIVDSSNYPLLTKAKHWLRVLLSDVATVQNGFAFQSSLFDRFEGIPLIRIRDICKSETEHRYTGTYTPEFVVTAGDILIGMDGDFTASKWKGRKALLNQRVCRLSPISDCIDEKFFFLCLQPFLNAINAETSSVTVKHLSSKTIGDIPLPLPPLNEQKRIVTKIEELFSELDNGIASLKIAQEKLKVYRQAVLKHAFEGKLTAQWREENKDKLETPEQLLARIQQEREKRYQEQLAEWEKAVAKWEANGKEEKKPSKPKMPQRTSLGLVDAICIPNEWTYSPAGNLNTDIFDGPFGSNLKSSDYVETGIRVIRLENIGEMTFIKDKYSYVSELKYNQLKQHTVFGGDIIFSSFITEGIRIAILPSSIDKAINKADCFCVRIMGETYSPRFLALYLSSRAAYKQIESEIHGVGRPRINTSQLKSFVIPICSIDEQNQILSEIDTKISEIDALERSIDEQLLRTEVLQQSILKKAFSGQLVPQDPSDEPARELLARIQAEKAAVQEQAKPAPMKRGRKVKEVNE